MTNPLDILNAPGFPADWRERALSSAPEPPGARAVAAYLTFCLSKRDNPSVDVKALTLKVLDEFNVAKTPYSRIKTVFTHYSSPEAIVKSFFQEDGYSPYTLWEHRGCCQKIVNAGCKRSVKISKQDEDALLGAVKISKQDEDALLGVRAGVSKLQIIAAILAKIQSQVSYKTFVQAADRDGLTDKDINIREFFAVFSVSSQTPQKGYDKAKQKVLLAVEQGGSDDREFIVMLDKLYGSCYQDYMNKLLAGS